jgi:hypothetical protein|tara:strand:+ start:1026 stop:1214 length:189 start_codon:yes stop_codon:yes gene_type:complete
MKYNNIKKMLKKQIDDGVKGFWTYDEDKKEFTNIYKNYTDKLKIYTPQQLLDKLEEYERQEA